jgi:quercetin dioxygenase-like cupin family protein
MREGIVVGPDEGARWQVGVTVQCKISSAQVGDAYTILDVTLPPQSGPTLHVHHREDEIFYVLTGECSVGFEDGLHVTPAGTTVVFPRGTPHLFRNHSDTAVKVLIMAVPGGLDRYFEEISSALESEQPERIAEINARYEIEFLVPSS